MKKLFFLLLLLVSCTTKEVANPKEIPFTEIVPLVSTALPVEPLRQLPDGFYLDSISYEDTSINYYCNMYFLQSSADKRFNEEILDFVHNMEKGEKPTEKNRPDQTLFMLWPTEVEVSKDDVICTFTDQSFTEGAAHYNHGSTTLRCDLKTHEVLLR